MLPLTELLETDPFGHVIDLKCIIQIALLDVGLSQGCACYLEVV